MLEIFHMLEILMSMKTARSGTGGNVNLQSVSDQYSEAYCEETVGVWKMYLGKARFVDCMLNNIIEC